MMSIKDINKKEVIASLEDYISWHKERSSTSPFSETRYKKAEEILAIVKNEPNNQGYHSDMVQAIYTLYRECVEEISGCKRESAGMSFSDAFYYIYHILVEENRVENKIKEYSYVILDSYRESPEEAMKIVLDIIIATKKEEMSFDTKRKLDALSDILRFLMRLI